MQRIPPITVNILQACQKCYKEETNDQKLSKCSQCRGVAYCNADCQKADWKAHKTICNAFAAYEKDVASRELLTMGLPNAASRHIEAVNDQCQQNMSKEINLFMSIMMRGLRVDERNMLGWQARCMGCSRTDRLIRIEGAKDKSIKPCDECKTSFYCCQAHWDVARDQHTDKPAEDSPGDLTQCQVNQRFRADIAFSNSMYESSDAHEHERTGKLYTFRWAPERHLPTWTLLKTGSKCWEEEFDAVLEKEKGFGSLITRAPFLRAATDGLSMPMTILFALQNLKSSDSWSRSEKLVIHLLGAQQKEVTHLQDFEEILHRLPALKDLRLVLIGPELATLPKPEWPLPCLECGRQGTKRAHEVHYMTYHEYVRKQGSKYITPDLAVAFNSGASENPSSWKETMKILVTRKVATVFTAYNCEEAEEEARLLRNAGATLVRALGPMKNPWGSLKLIPEPNRVTGFYATNGWLAGGFCE
ncbi:hypothetical protein V5O48_004989 [Marasmius crinis-equi]|uniref:MYND-type domain-containing protein n=1 Tax=Marasmius crinis-equi TaxID=585013 RepID=A0ABR3FNH7_9AGAR